MAATEGAYHEAVCSTIFRPVLPLPELRQEGLAILAHRNGAKIAPMGL
jgi:hypothetical protein